MSIVAAAVVASALVYLAVLLVVALETPGGDANGDRRVAAVRAWGVPMGFVKCLGSAVEG